MAGLCLLVVWEWLKKLWDCLDAWWAGSQTTSRRARRLRRMQRAIEDELASQLQGMTLDDQPCVQEQPASSATLRGEPCTAPPVASQPAVRVSNPSRRCPSVREQEVQTDPPAFRRLTETRTEPPMPPQWSLLCHTAWRVCTYQPAVLGPQKCHQQPCSQELVPCLC